MHKDKTVYPRTLVETKQLIDEGEISSKDLVAESLKVIEQHEPQINAFVEVLADEALEQAAKWDKKTLSERTKVALGGIPIGIKDVILTLEGHTQAASNMLRGFKAPYEATSIRYLKAAGGIILGKTNCDAYAMGASCEYSDFGMTYNPWDQSRVPGGSSGGSAAAIAAGEVMATLGTDTGGSVRHPSSFCNTVGMRPTYGRVSRFGIIAYGSSFDQVGPITRTVQDSALLLEIIAGSDERDATTSSKPVGNYTAACGQDISNMIIGIPSEFFGEGVAPAVAKVVREAITEIEKLGARIKKVSLPLTSVAVPVYYILAKSEGSTNLGRYDSLRYGEFDKEVNSLLDHYVSSRGEKFGPEVKRTILMGTYALSAGYFDAWYRQASKVRTLIAQEYAKVFEEVDVILGPTVPELPFKIGEKSDDPLAMYLTDALVVGASVAGIPALSLPAGFSDGLPVGMQLIAPSWEEERLFQVGHAYEQTKEWWKMTPSLA